MYDQLNQYFMQSWHDMFVLSVPVLEKMMRPIIVYVFLIVGLRIAGKREMAQLNPFDLVVLLTLSNTVQNAIIGEDNSVTGGVLGASTLLAVNYLVVRFLYSHPKLEQLCEGEAQVLVENGQILYENLRCELVTQQQLEIAAHRQGFKSLSEVQRATLEPGGGISFEAHEPIPAAQRHNELMEKLDAIGQELAGLRGRT